MIELGQRLVSEAHQYRGVGHPLEMTHDLSPSFEAVADDVTRVAGLAERMPRLAQLVAASPLDAAIHDAYGKALGQNSCNLLGRSLSVTTWRPISARILPVSISINTLCGSPNRGCRCTI